LARICPKCGSQRIHRSHRRGAAEHLLAFLGLKPRRCHECNARFSTLGNSVLFRKDVDSLLRKVSAVVLAALAVFAVVSVVMWLSRRDALPPAAAVPRQGPPADRSAAIPRIYALRRPR
jgi:hypothetical protein